MDAARASSSRRRNLSASASDSSSRRSRTVVTGLTLYLSSGGLESNGTTAYRCRGTAAYHAGKVLSEMTAVTLPPGPSAPRLAQGVYALTVPLRGMRRLRDRYGDAFTINVPIFGRAVVISDPAQVKQLFTAGPDLVDNLEPTRGRVLGPGSLFALTGTDHRKQRKLLVPPFHGRRLAAYEKIIEDETVRELASWPEDREFATLPSMMRVTLGAILRAVFGAEGAEL